MDDFAVYSNDHLRHVEATLHLAVNNKMKIDPGKAHSYCTNVELIGHQVSTQGIHVMPKKVERCWHGND